MFNHQREPWRTIVADLARQESNQTIVWVDDLSVPAFDYYIRRNSVRSDLILWTPLFGRKLPQLPNLVPETNNDTLWIVTVENVYHDLIPLLPADFYSKFRLLETHHEAGIGLYRYQRQNNPLVNRPDKFTGERFVQWGMFLPSPLDTCHEP